LGSLSSQLGGALGYQTQMTGLSRNISGLSQQAAMYNMQANRALGQAQLFGSIGQFSGQLEGTTLSDLNPFFLFL
jgi:hypothetical protein